MRTLAATLSACLALGLVAVGCGGDDDEGDGGGGGGAATTTEKQPATGGGGAAATVDVSMKDIEFKPKTVDAAKGGSVKWTNDDSVGHDVTASDFKSGDPGGMGSGDSFTRKFNAAGTFSYRCTVHPGMEGTVVVK
jgi:plastocyanin